MAKPVAKNTNDNMNEYYFHNYWYQFNNFLSTFIPISILTGLCVAIGSAFAGTFGMVMALGFATALNFTIYYFSADIVLAMYDAHDISCEDVGYDKELILDELVSDLANEYGIPKPKVNIVEKGFLNAFATGRNPENAVVVATRGLLDRVKIDPKYDNTIMPDANFLTKKELKAIFAHELGHVINYDILVSTIVATMAGALGIVADYMRQASIWGTRDNEDDSALGRVCMWLVAAIIPVIASVLQYTVSRSRESNADCTGANIMGEGQSLASALKKIHRFSKESPLKYSVSKESEGLVGATKHLFIADPFSSDASDCCTGSQNPFDVSDLPDSNESTLSYLFSFFSSHPDTRQRVQDLEGIDHRMVRKI
tara:strand:- start:19571 stop:20677 length:1107 start_codon:yes stop_codon:yes gene_type:complete